jgi:release factor glutamine methyltransferase
MLTLKAALEEATAAIGRVDAQAIFTHLLGVNRAYLAANPMRVLTETEDARIDTLVARRSIGHPVAYLLGEREFYSRPFMVGPDVLIPRPETETLVEQALARVASTGRCLDLGTGSGAIAVTLACERPGLAVTATDTSTAALALARANASALGCAGRIDFRQGPWYGPVAGRRFDLIVANPPYVAAADPHLGEGDLRFEPRAALTDGSADGLDSIRAIVRGALSHLEAGAWLLFEHGHDQARAVRAMLEAAGFVELVSIADLAGIPRVAGGKIQTSNGRNP